MYNGIVRIIDGAKFIKVRGYELLRIWQKKKIDSDHIHTYIRVKVRIKFARTQKRQVNSYAAKSRN